ncbi:MAG: hypothetical protein QXG39_07040 [Candidatus Aenigmatarchaeota archaeon]
MKSKNQKVKVKKKIFIGFILFLLIFSFISLSESRPLIPEETMTVTTGAGDFTLTVKKAVGTSTNINYYILEDDLGFEYKVSNFKVSHMKPPGKQEWTPSEAEMKEQTELLPKLENQLAEISKEIPGQSIMFVPTNIKGPEGEGNLLLFFSGDAKAIYENPEGATIQFLNPQDLKGVKVDDLAKSIASQYKDIEGVDTEALEEAIKENLQPYANKDSIIQADKLPNPTQGFSIGMFTKGQLAWIKTLNFFEKAVQMLPIMGKTASAFIKWGKYNVGPRNESFLKAIKWNPEEGNVLTKLRFIFQIIIDIHSTILSWKLNWEIGDAHAERPLKGTKWCELCNWDNYTACTEERCRILGQCVYKSVPDQRQGICLPAVCAEGYPKIKAINASFMIDATHVDKTVNSTGCPDSKGACAVDAGEVSYSVSSVRIVVETEQYAECRYIIDKKGANFSEMNSIEGDIYMPKTRQFEIDTGPLEPGREHVVYIKCASTCNEHPPGFDYNYVKFKLGEKPDEVPPVIVMVEPDDKMQYISDKLGQATIRIYLDENGSCGYSTKRENFTSNYTEQHCENNNSVMCHIGDKAEAPAWQDEQGNTIGQFVLGGGCMQNQRCVYKDALGQVHYLNYYNCTVCNLTINLSDVFADMFNWTQMGEDLSKFSETCKSDPSTVGCAEFTKYVTEKGIDVSQIKTMGVNKLFSLNFRCKDSKGNKMPVEDIYEYRLLTFPAYNITIISPSRGYSTSEKTIELSVESSRPAKCRYDYVLASGGARKLEQRYENMTPIDDTLSTSHSTFLENLAKGTYNLSVKCRDLGNMETEANTSFTIQQAPMPNITRMFSEGNDLRLETDVKARCVYSIDESIGCKFDPNKASNFSSGDAYHHIATLVKEWTYYVKCRDIWGDNNWPRDSCSIIVKPFELPSAGS